MMSQQLASTTSITTGQKDPKNSEGLSSSVVHLGVLLLTPSWFDVKETKFVIMSSTYFLHGLRTRESHVFSLLFRMRLKSPAKIPFLGGDEVRESEREIQHFFFLFPLHCVWLTHKTIEMIGWFGLFHKSVRSSDPILNHYLCG